MKFTCARGRPVLVSDPQSAEALHLERFQRSGKSTDFELLVNAWHVPAFRIAQTITRNTSLAEEVVQEAFLDLANGSAQFKPGTGSPRAWFLGVVINRARVARRSELRAQKRKQVSGSDFLLRKGRDEQGLAPSKDVELQSTLRSLLSSTEERLRLPLVLRFLNGLSQKDIAAVLGVSQQTVSQRIEKGLKNLRHELTRAGFSVAVSLEKVFEQLAADRMGHPVGLAQKIMAQAESIKLSSPAGSERFIKGSAKGSVSSLGWTWTLLGSLALAVAAAGSAWKYYQEQPSEPNVQPAVSSVTNISEPKFQSKSEPPPAPPFHEKWTFQNGVPSNLDFRGGFWSKAQSGMKAALVPKVQAFQISFPQNVFRRPFQVDLSVRWMPQKEFWGVEFVLFQARKVVPPKKVWRYFLQYKVPNRHPMPLASVSIIFTGKYLLKIVNGKVFGLEEYSAANRPEHVVLRAKGWRLEALEIRSLVTADIPSWMLERDEIVDRFQLKRAEWSPGSGGYIKWLKEIPEE